MLRSLTALSLAFAAAAEELPEMSPLRARCVEALTGLSRSGHSDQEVAAFCRAAYPAEMCTFMRSSLGQQPWSQERLGATCQGWQDHLSARFMDMPEERRAMS